MEVVVRPPRNMSQLGVKPSTAGEYQLQPISATNANQGVNRRMNLRASTRHSSNRYSYLGADFILKE